METCEAWMREIEDRAEYAARCVRRRLWMRGIAKLLAYVGGTVVAAVAVGYGLTLVLN